MYGSVRSRGRRRARGPTSPIRAQVLDSPSKNRSHKNIAEQHAPLDLLRRLVGDETHDDIFTFTFWRYPIVIRRS